MEQYQKIGKTFTALGLIFLYLAALFSCLHIVGTDDGLYYRLQMRANVLSEAGVDAVELRSIDTALADYLSGDAHALDVWPGRAFGETELTHMADCYSLFELLRRVVWLTATAAVLFIAAGAFLLRRGFWGCARRWALLGAGVLLLLIAALAVWGALDFDGLFTAFHRLLFRNDLWLLNPQTDLLIRICPESMFMVMACWIGGLELAVILVVNVLLRIFSEKSKRRHAR